MNKLTSPYQNKLEFIKNPVIAEFLGMQQNTAYYESDLEQFIIDNLQSFIMELGKGYAFVARQQHIHTDKEDYYVDLVFYNYLPLFFILQSLILRSHNRSRSLAVRCKQTHGTRDRHHYPRRSMPPSRRLWRLARFL